MFTFCTLNFLCHINQWGSQCSSIYIYSLRWSIDCFFSKSMGQLKLLESNLSFKKFLSHSDLRQETCLQTLREFHQLLFTTFNVELITKKLKLTQLLNSVLRWGFVLNQHGDFFFNPLKDFPCAFCNFISNNQRQKNDLKKYTLAFAVQVSRSPQAVLRMSRFLSWGRSVNHAVDAFVRADSHHAPAVWGGVGMGEGPFSGIVWLTARDADCPRGLGPPAPPRRPTVTQTMQCYNCGSDLTPTPFKSRPHPMYSANPSWPPPTPSTDLDTGSGDTLSFHSVQFRHGGFALQLCPTKVNIFMTQIAAWHRRLLRFPRQRTEAGWVHETLLGTAFLVKSFSSLYCLEPNELLTMVILYIQIYKAT